MRSKGKKIPPGKAGSGIVEFNDRESRTYIDDFLRLRGQKRKRGRPIGKPEWTKEEREQIERRLTTAAEVLRNSNPSRKRTRENMAETAVIDIKTLDAWLEKLKRRLDSF